MFGVSHLAEICGKFNLPLLGRIPIDQRLAEAVDAGKIELVDEDYLPELPKALAALDK